VYRISSLSTSFAQDWQSQMPLPIPRLCPGVNDGSYLGPLGEAAVMCAATPTFRALSSSVCGPLVRFLHLGFEQRLPTRLASTSATAFGNSSRIPSSLKMVGSLGQHRDRFIVPAGLGIEAALPTKRPERLTEGPAGTAGGSSW
jgi:hypothetical protein